MVNRRRSPSLHNGMLVLKRASVGLRRFAVAADRQFGRRRLATAAASGASARAYAIRVVVPGDPGGATPTVAAPMTPSSSAAASTTTGLVTTGSANASAPRSRSRLGDCDCFSGGQRPQCLRRRDHRHERRRAGPRERARRRCEGRHRPAPPSRASSRSASSCRAERLALADWGSLTAVAGGAQRLAPRPATAAASLRSRSGSPPITADCPPGRRSSSATRRSRPRRLRSAPARSEAEEGRSRRRSRRPPPGADAGIPAVRQPPHDHAEADGGRLRLPRLRPVVVRRHVRRARGDISSGWHHGDDIFAPLGAPILAVASGTVFSVGWNTIGGNRLWLRDGQGNLFYYAHLSAFTPLAVNGNKVNAGDVLGFVGNTGDAQGTPFHLHFEVHPVGLLGLGYDGAVNPTSYLGRGSTSRTSASRAATRGPRCTASRTRRSPGRSF